MRFARKQIPLAAFLLIGGCVSGEAPHDEDGGHAHGNGAEPWAVTAWGEHFEIFAEADPLAAGQVSMSHTHVTVLRDFSPLREGLVEIVLRRGGEEKVFSKELPLRDGIFDVAIEPSAEGVYDLFFRIEGPVRTERIAAGRVRVGTAHDPGGLEEARGDPDGEAISFL